MRALVVGAGPAGASAAIALARRGIETIVVESEPVIRPAGVGLLLQNSPLRALDTLGLVEDCVERGFVHRDIQVCDAEGTPRATIAPPSLVAHGPSMVGLSRAALSQVLGSAMADAGVELALATTVTGLRERENHVEVTLDSGRVHRVDVLVAADGLHSRTRALFLPHAPQPAASGQVIWRASAPRPPAVDRYWMLDAGPVAGKVGLVPIAPDEIYLWLLQSDTGAPRPSPRDALAALRGRLEPFGGHVPEVAAVLRPDVDVRALATLLVPAPWSQGRCVVIGDAAHTTTPHIAYGVGMAIEDAVVLADLLDPGTDVPASLAEFTERRFERCRLVVESSVQLGQWEQEPPDDRSLPHQLTARTLGALAAAY